MPGDASLGYQLAGRLESAGRLTSDPQLGRSLGLFVRGPGRGATFEKYVTTASRAAV